jgi:DNA-binding PadR family transcriptional regulator
MTNAELAILSLIVEQPRHGYEIEQVIEERGMRDWTEMGFSSIYYLLKKLEREGLLQGQLQQEAVRGPARKVYRITEHGQEVYRASVLDALSAPRRWYSSLLLGLASLPRVPPLEALAALEQYRESLAERLAAVRGRWESQRPLPSHVEAMFDYSVTMIQAEKTWVEKLIKETEKQHEQG